MKKLLTVSMVSLLIAGCGGSGGSGGVLTDNTPTVVSSTPTPVPVGDFDASQSSFLAYKGSTVVPSSGVGVNDTVKIVLVAKDTNGNLKTGLNVQFTNDIELTNPATTSATESSPGQYTYSVQLPKIGTVNFKAIVNTVSTTLTQTVTVSACNNPTDPGSAPFHSTYVLGSVSTKVICTATEFAAMALPANLSGKYLINSDIDFTSYYSSNAQFKIGTSNQPFTGYIYGYQYTLNNFKYTSTTEDNVGMFGCVSDSADIEAFNVSNATIQGVNNVGLIGQITTNSTGVTVNSIGISASSITGSGNRIGGLIGSADSNQKVTIQSLSLSSMQPFTPIQNQTAIGGAIGYGRNVNLTNPNISVNLTASGTDYLITNVGGVIGESDTSSVTGGYVSINQTYKNASTIGGIFGKATNSIISSIPNISIFIFQNGASSITNSGGLIGQMIGGSVTNSSVYLFGYSLNGEFGGLASKVSNATVTSLNIGGSASMVGSGTILGGFSAESTGSTYSKDVSNVTLSTSVTNSIVGGIIGQSTSDIISKSYSTGNISAAGSAAGGIIGSSSSSSISNSYSLSSVTSATAGGLIGQASGSTVQQTYSSGTISGSTTTGGVIGSNLNGSISSSFTTTTVSNGTLPGALIGTNSSSSVNTSSLYYLDSGVSICGTSSSASCAGTPEQGVSYFYLSSNAPLSSWDFSSVWTNNSNTTLPTLR